jgi:hypothetical protein
MTKQPSLRFLIYRPEVYRIRVGGLLDLEWSKLLGGMTLSDVPGKPQGKFTELAGRLPAQAGRSVEGAFEGAGWRVQ